MNLDFSVRKFLVVGIEGESWFQIEFDLYKLLNEDSEVAFSLQEEIDRILDLKKGQALFVNISRDDRENKGVIKRIT